MKTKVFGVFFTLLIISFTASAQDRIPFSQNSSFDNQFKEVRALVVGISNYKNLPMEKQLEYASDDAMGFYNFLK